jgi:hypothetical protein
VTAGLVSEDIHRRHVSPGRAWSRKPPEEDLATAERLIVTDEPVALQEPIIESDIVYICARCDMEIAGEPVRRAGEVYWCQSCPPATGCTCLSGECDSAHAAWADR